VTAIILIKFLVFVSLSVAGFLIVQKYIHHTKREKHNEIAGFVFGTIGVVYAVLLAFVVITVWSEYADTEKNINIEASHIIDIYRNADAFPEPIRAEIQTACISYVNDLIEYEWPAMRTYDTSREASKSYLELWRIHQNYRPESEFEKIWYAETIKELNLLGDARTYRINAIHFKLHPFMWLVLISGAFITIVVSYLFGTGNKSAHIFMIIALAVSVGMILILIESLEHPFAGIISIEPDAFRMALRQLMG
jgi:hypothetical protein